MTAPAPELTGYWVTVRNAAGYWRVVEVDARSPAEARARATWFLGTPHARELEDGDHDMATAWHDIPRDQFVYRVAEVTEADEPAGSEEPSFTDDCGEPVD